MRSGYAFIAIVLASFVLMGAALAQTCPNTNPDTDPQLGCPQPFYAQVSKPYREGSAMEFNITVTDRRIAFPPDCNPGDLSCFDNVNSQGLPLCQAWSGGFSGVKVELTSCYPNCRLSGCPNCDFNVSVSPSKPQNLTAGQSANFTVRIESYRISGNYDFAFSAFLASVKEKIFSMHLNMSTQPFGTEGDNAMCTDCSSRQCDTNPAVCRSSCPAATYCTAPDCFFDTSNSDAAQSCCGDDSGEILRRCMKSPDVKWGCPATASCCGDRASCAYDGKCYPEGNAYLVAAGEDQYSYCYQAAWHDCDESANICSGCGFIWSNATSSCCGDDSSESIKSRMCFSGCNTSLADKSCCGLASDCVYEGKCYATEDVIQFGKKNITCAGGVWYEKVNATNQTCYKGTCNTFDKCDGSCPGCVFKDYSCYGNSCEADFIDPDMHWTYCSNCSLNWSFSQKLCCGDDPKEFWVPPCPNVNASWMCCSNPSDRVNAAGECVISCGIGMAANLTEFTESQIPFSFSLPDTVEVNAGRVSEFKVTVRTDGSQPLHNVSLDLCGPFSFQYSPSYISELRPGEPKEFTVGIFASPDSAAGAQEFAVYVSASEFIRQRYKPAVANISMADYSYDIYFAVIAAVAGVFIVKKLSGRRGAKPAKAPAGKTAKAGAVKSHASAQRKLAQLVASELAKGTEESEIKEMLESHGIESGDIDAAFRQAKKKV